MRCVLVRLPQCARQQVPEGVLAHVSHSYSATCRSDIYVQLRQHIAILLDCCSLAVSRGKVQHTS